MAERLTELYLLDQREAVGGILNGMEPIQAAAVSALVARYLDEQRSAYIRWLCSLTE